MQTFLIKWLSWPFIALGFAWQFISGSFYAGRILSTVWIGNKVEAKVAAAVAKSAVKH